MPRSSAYPSTDEWLSNRRAGVPWVLLETTRAGSEDGRSLRFSQPAGSAELHAGQPVAPFFDALEDALSRELWAAGYVGYEAGLLFESKLPPPPTGELPLAWFGFFEAPDTIDEVIRTPTHARPGGEGPVDATPENAPVHRADPGAMTRDRYRERFARIQGHITRGDTYQVNYTFPLEIETSLPPENLYLALRARQRVSWAACLYDGGRHVISLSPEMFLARDDLRIRARPMKGTAPRRSTPSADRAVEGWLRADVKNRAENVMIVDMIRNDFGRLTAGGAVDTPSLFDVETYETLHQMTSTVEANIRPGIAWREIFAATFPCASVTGAPKVRTMEIISELEDTPRGVYTGAIGYIAPGGSARFNVAIRTLEFDGNGGARMGVGSGVVANSSADAEYDECLLKAQFLGATIPCEESVVAGEPLPGGGCPSRSVVRPASAPRHRPWVGIPADVKIVETLCVRHGLPLRASDHMERMEASARTLGYAFSKDRAESAVTEATRPVAPGRLRLRIELSRDGRIETDCAPLDNPWRAPVRVALWPDPVDSSAPWLAHKTTYRPAYTEARKALAGHDADEFVFMNERGEITEGSISNLFIEVDGRLYTPPVRCGLLPGTLRARLLADGSCFSRVIHADDLRSADRLFVGNAVRGLVGARLFEQD